MSRTITLKLKDPSQSTPEIEAWLEKAEAAVNGEIDEAMQQYMTYGGTEPPKFLMGDVHVSLSVTPSRARVLEDKS